MNESDRLPKPDNVGGIDAEFGGLVAEAAKVDGDIAPALPEPAAQAAQEQQEAMTMQDEVAELAGLLQIVSSMFFPLLPSLQDIYKPENCAALAGATVPVMRKHGWSVSGIMGGWGEEIALAMIVAPLGWATWSAAKSDIAAAEAKARSEAIRQANELTGAVKHVENRVPGADEPQLTERG